MKHALLLKLLEPLAILASGIGKQKKLFILIYHRVLDEPDFMRPGEVDKVAFTWQMELLAKHFNVLPLNEAMQRMQDNTLPSRAVCITFDDGYADNYTNALPILKKFNLTATFFIASGFLDGGRMWNDTVIESVRNMQSPVLDLTEIGLDKFNVADDIQKSQVASQILQKIKHLSFEQRNQYTTYIADRSHDLPDDLMMTSEQLTQLYLSGMEVGGHTVNHPILLKLDDQTADWEIIQNKRFLESLLKINIRIFAYPNGKLGEDYLSKHVEKVKSSGFQLAVTTEKGVVKRQSELMQLPRFTPWDKSPLLFAGRMILVYFKGAN